MNSLFRKIDPLPFPSPLIIPFYSILACNLNVASSLRNNPQTTAIWEYEFTIQEDYYRDPIDKTLIKILELWTKIGFLFLQCHNSRSDIQDLHNYQIVTTHPSEAAWTSANIFDTMINYKSNIPWSSDSTYPNTTVADLYKFYWWRRLFNHTRSHKTRSRVSFVHLV